MSTEDNTYQEIIIIRRGNEEEDAHHGGAWKIAFADFMTAMMALFLVLWLINAANEETKRAVASYFNPVKLVDRNRSKKGIDEQKSGASSLASEVTTTDETKPSPNSSTSVAASSQSEQRSEPGKSSEAQFFDDPHGAIDEIEKAWTPPKPSGVAASDGFSSANNAEQFTDPFIPTPTSDAAAQTDALLDAGVPTVPTITPSGVAAAPEPAGDKIAEDAKDDITAREVQRQIKEALENANIDASLIEPSISVTMTDKGILITISDTLDSPMFGVGSAVPAPNIVVAVEAIAVALKAQAGPIHIFGHTDARKFQNEADGNWRLSTDRARATYFILMHGGIDEKRIAEISGFADRKLHNQEDPMSGENRRIEILLGAG